MIREFRTIITSVITAVALGGTSTAYEKIRVYEFGENDPGAVIGGTALSTVDSQSSPTYMDAFTDGPDFLPPDPPAGQEFVDIFAPDDNSAPTYAAGRLTGLSLNFGGDDYLEGDPFDPRPNSKGAWTEVNPLDFSYGTLSQAWAKPSSAGLGTKQVLWSVGAENGGVAITEDGFWEIVHPNRQLSMVPVEFDEWSHLTMRRHGNGAALYINGEVVGESEGFWGTVGPLTVGAGMGGLDPYIGLLDDFNIATYRGPGTAFDAAQDIDFFSDLKLSGVPGDVDQDAKVDDKDYQIWSTNSGFDNGLGYGDPSTLLLGDLDQNGRINYFDFQIIADQAVLNGVVLNVIPEPSTGLLALLGSLSLFRRAPRIRRRCR
jgi:hypothetical protein